MFALAVAILPTLSLAANPPIKKIENTEKRLQEGRRDLKQEVKDLKDLRKNGSSTNASSAREDRRDSRVKIFELANGLQKNITREINQVKNLIGRLTGTNSIVAKLDAKGINTTAIKTKLTEASTLADKAQTELSLARNIIASTTVVTASTSIQTLKNRALEARKALATAHSSVKQAIGKIKEARKLIAQIPGIKVIENGPATSTSATSTATSTN